MIKKTLLLLILFLTTNPSLVFAQQSGDNLKPLQEEKPIKPSVIGEVYQGIPNLNYMVSLGMGFESFFYFDNDKYGNNASENFLKLSLNVAYYPLKYFSFSISSALLLFPSYSNSGIDPSHSQNFPNDITRVGGSIGAQIEGNWGSFKDNLIYVLLGLDFIYLPKLSNTNTSVEVTYPRSSKKFLYTKFGIGNRFNLFPNIIFDITFFILLPFTKQTSFTGDGDLKLNNVTLGIDFAFGYFG